MLQKISCKLVETMFSGITVDEKEVCSYGLELLLSTVINTVGLMLIGVAFHRPVDAGIIVALFYLFQTVGGGYHAKTHFTCFLTMAFGLSGALWIMNNSILEYEWKITIVLSSIIIMLLIPVVVNGNKSYLADQYMKYKRRSLWITLLFGVWGTVFFMNADYGISFALGISVSAISRICGAISQNTR